MPMWFREGLVYLPGDEALYTPKKEEQGIKCVINKLIPGEKNILSEYNITLVDSQKKLNCALNELVLLPKK